MLHTISTLDQLKPILIGFRKSQGLTQQDMADMLGVAQQTYQKLESTPQNITVDRLFKVLGLLGVKLCLSDSTTLVSDKPSKICLTKITSKPEKVTSKNTANAKIGKVSTVKVSSKKQTSVMKKKSKKEEW